MIEVSIDQADLRRWLIVESAQRWVTAVRRFSPELMPKPLVPEIMPTTAGDASTQLSGHNELPMLVLWESFEESLLPVCDQIISAAQTSPEALQIVAAADCTDRERTILLELPCAAILRHPEDLVNLKRMIRSHFCRGSAGVRPAVLRKIALQQDL